jgi:hypothetical protein
MKRLFYALMLLTALPVFAQKTPAPLVKRNYSGFTSYVELTKYIYQLAAESKLMKVEPIGKSVQGRNLYAMKFSSSEFGKDDTKIKVLFLAQQHGNEPSGKEGALLLAQQLLKPENRYLFDKIDLAIIPQMNPDGSEANKRLNAHEMDLNRNHMIMTEPEVIALHKFFDRYLFEVTMDVHEYYPFEGKWKQAGYMINSDELTGPCNNPGVSENIKALANQSFLPFIKKYFTERHFTNTTYSPGGPPGVNYTRHSTFDINDGRQSFGIQNTFSFIQEGLNGIDYTADRLQHRAEGQMTGMQGLLEFSYGNAETIKKLVAEGRKELITGSSDKAIAIQCEHATNGQTFQLPVHAYRTNNDTALTIVDYRPVVKTIHDVTRPEGYLIPKKLKELTDWIDRMALATERYTNSPARKIEQYSITRIDSIDFEGDIIVDPAVTVKNLSKNILEGDYIYIPTAQLKGTMLVNALEPKGMLGLVTYKEFAHLLKVGEDFGVLRVVK